MPQLTAAPFQHDSNARKTIPFTPDSGQSVMSVSVMPVTVGDQTRDFLSTASIDDAQTRHLAHCRIDQQA